MPPRKRLTTSNVKKEPEETPILNCEYQYISSPEPEAAEPPKKRMTLESTVPMTNEKQPEAVNKQPMNVLTQMQDVLKTVEKNYTQFKKEAERMQKHGINNCVVTDEFADKIKEMSENANALNALIPDSVKIQPIRKRIQLTIKNCRELFTKEKFFVKSTPIELVGFKWSLDAKVGEKGNLALYLHAKPPDGFKGNYRIDVDYRFSILNAGTFADKDLIEEEIGEVYIMDENYPSGYGWGCDMAKFEDLLDPDKTFLTPDGDIETWVDFTIKSTTLHHLT